MDALDRIDPRYRVILCDVWGCIHDGVDLYPGVVERLRDWRAHGLTVILITNAPRTAGAVEVQLTAIGLPRDCWDGIATAGDAGIAGLNALGRPVGFLGTSADREVLEAEDVPIADGGDFCDLACTGLDGQRRRIEDYHEQLAGLAGRGVVMHCLNPDRVVVRGGALEPCAGALADVYETLGGEVVWYGKPHPAIYRHAMHLAGDPPPAAVLAIGDGLETDILGAALMGYDCVFVSGGIHGGEPFPADFGKRHGFGDWRPLAVVQSLG